MNAAKAEEEALQRAISERIRALRLDRQWSLDRLAEKTGLSKSYLSQIENGEKTPPIGTLTKIAFGLGVDAVFLITGEARQTDTSDRCALVRSHERRSILHRGAPAGYHYESINFNKCDRIMDAYVVTMGPEIPKEPLIHEGQEIAYALEGRHEFNYNGRKMILNPGDCVCFDSNLPHYSRSLDKKPAKVLVVFKS